MAKGYIHSATGLAACKQCNTISKSTAFASVVDEVVQYENLYRLCYIRGPEGILIGLALASNNRLQRRKMVF